MATEILQSESVNSHNHLSYAQLIALAESYKEQFPDTMNILEIAGVSPFGSREMINPYTKESDTEDFSNVGRHCVAVAFVASKIADRLNLSQEEKAEVIEAALRHDADKRLEVMRKKAKKAGVEIDVYGEEGYKTIESIFSDKGLDSKTFFTIQSMGGMTGHNSLKKFLITKDGKLQLNPDRTFVEMIVHIADDMTHSSFGEDGEATQYVSFEKRAALSKFSEKYGFLWQEGFGVSEENGIQEIKDVNLLGGKNVKNFYDWQNIVFEMICDHIQKQIDSTNSENSVEFLLDIINKKSSSLIEGVAGKVEKNL